MIVVAVIAGCCMHSVVKGTYRKSSLLLIVRIVLNDMNSGKMTVNIGFIPFHLTGRVDQSCGDRRKNEERRRYRRQLIRRWWRKETWRRAKPWKVLSKYQNAISRLPFAMKKWKTLLNRDRACHWLAVLTFGFYSILDVLDWWWCCDVNATFNNCQHHYKIITLNKNNSICVYYIIYNLSS